MTTPRVPRDTQFDFTAAMTIAVGVLALATAFAVAWRYL